MLLPAAGQGPGGQSNPPRDAAAGGSVTGSSGGGLVNWNDPQYGWIDSVYTHCNDYFVSQKYWSEKFWPPVLDASPDGKTILLNRGRGLVLYDITTRSVRVAVTGSFERANWSNDGRYIAAVRYWTQKEKNPYVIYDVREGRPYTLPVPDSAVPVADIVWLPGDTTIVTWLRFPGDVKAASYAISVRPPYTIKRFSGVEYHHYHDQQGFDLAGDGSSVWLRVGDYGDAAPRETYTLKGATEISDFSQLSPDGNWLAVRMWAEFPADRFPHQPNSNVTALGIVDLRPGSPTRFKFYRMFPDYTNSYRNCSQKWSFAGMAWSGDSRGIYHEWVRMSDSTTQIVRRDIENGSVEPVSNFLAAP
jgi:hypothetical protein